MYLDVVDKIFDQDVPSIIKNYIELYGILDLKQINLLKQLFEKIDKFELEETNVITDGLITDGLVMIPKTKENQQILDETQINNYINKLMKNIDNIQDGYYLKSLVTLIKQINYIDYEEQVILNFLFYELNVGTKKIELVDDEQEKFRII